MTHPLLGSNISIRYNSKLSRCFTKMAIVAEQLVLGMWPTILHLLSPKQHSIRFVHISHIGTKRKLVTKAGSPNILVHVVATYDAFQAVLSFLCRHVHYISLTFTLKLVHLLRITEWYEDIQRTSLLNA